jgi:hypothetical protein
VGQQARAPGDKVNKTLAGMAAKTRCRYKSRVSRSRSPCTGPRPPTDQLCHIGGACQLPLPAHQATQEKLRKHLAWAEIEKVMDMDSAKICWAFLGTFIVLSALCPFLLALAFDRKHFVVECSILAHVARPALKIIYHSFQQCAKGCQRPQKELAEILLCSTVIEIGCS